MNNKCHDNHNVDNNIVLHGDIMINDLKIMTLQYHDIRYSGTQPSALTFRVIDP